MKEYIICKVYIQLFSLFITTLSINLYVFRLLLAFIKKDKQADSLLEKLIQRMQGVINK